MLNTVLRTVSAGSICAISLWRVYSHRRSKTLNPEVHDPAATWGVVESDRGLTLLPTLTTLTPPWGRVNLLSA